jgi:hypothetical protein
MTRSDGSPSPTPPKPDAPAHEIDPAADIDEILAATSSHLVDAKGDYLDPRLVSDLARYQFWYSLCGPVVGTVCMIGGIYLFVQGVAGTSTGVTSFFGAQSSLTDAAPGALLFWRECSWSG